MSLHVTVNKTHVCVRPKRFLSTSESQQIRENERARRRRLRIEQVREQSKDISKKVLQQAKNAVQKELNYLESNEQSELRRLRDDKILEIQRRYEADMENIGLAHETAAMQLNAEAVLQAKQRENQVAASARGKVAMQRLANCVRAEDVKAKQQETRRHVREVEDLRSSLVASLAKKSQTPKAEISQAVPTVSSSGVPTTPKSITDSKRKEEPKKRRIKKTPGKKSPVKVVSKPSHVKTSISHKTSPHIHIPINDARSPHSKRVQSAVPSSQSAKYDPSDYIQVLTCSNTSSGSSLISDDSSYFSEGTTLQSTVRKNTSAKPCQTETCPSTSKSVSTGVSRSQIKLYDHHTRHRGSYMAPEGIVERTNIQNEPSAHEVAQKIVAEGPITSNLDNQRLVALQRGQDAALREEVRRNYRILLKNLDTLSREERKLNATRTGKNIANLPASRRKEIHDKRQRVMNRAFDAVVSDSEAVATEMQSEAIITLEPTDEVHSTRPCAQSRTASYREVTIYPEDDVLSREEQILDMLKKVERQKRLLLKEFGVKLPDDILSASLTPLFNVQPQFIPEVSLSKDSRPPPPPSPEIKVINMSECDTSAVRPTSPKPKNKMKPPPVAQKTETAVQTNKHTRAQPERTSSIAEDKGTQVELSPINRRVSSPQLSAASSERPEHVEPVVTIIAHGADTSSESSDHKFVINVTKGTVEVTPRKSKSRSSKSRSISSSNSNMPINRVSTSVNTSPPSRPNSPDTTREMSTSTQSSSTLSTSNSTMQGSRHMRPNISPVSVDKSTDNTQSTIEICDSVAESLPRRSARRSDSMESSDRSTSYAIPPVPRGQMFNIPDRNRLKDILELVDSSANETLPRAARDISPVSTPATPSSSVMGVPSNIPNPSRLARILTFPDAPEQTDTSTSFVGKESNYDIKRQQAVKSKGRNCRCSNPQCRNYHRKYQLNHITEQSLCEQRIASLDAQLHQVRDEQRNAVDYSFLAPSDTTSLMQMPQRLPGANNDIIERLTSIESNLLKTLKTPVPMHQIPSVSATQMESSPVDNSAKFFDKITSTEKIPLKPRPIIVNDEPVNIDLQRYRIGKEPLSVEKHDDNIVEQLSREILQQTQAEKPIESKTAATNVECKQLPISPRRKNVDRATEIDMVDAKSPTNLDKSFSPVLVDAKQTMTISSPVQGDNLSVQKHLSSRIPRELESSRVAEAASPKMLKKFPESARKMNVDKSQDMIALSDGINNIINNESKTVKSPNASVDYSAVPQSRLKPPDHMQQVKTMSPGELVHKHGENYGADESVKSSDSFLIRCSTRKVEHDTLRRVTTANGLKACEMIKSQRITTSNSSNSISSFSGISEIMSTPSSDSAVLLTPPDNIEDYLMGLGIAWLVPLARKTREASALSSSSNSDVTLTVTKRTKSPIKKTTEASWALPDLSDVSSISIKEASKSTEKTVLMKARTSTPNMPNVYYTSEKSSFTTTSTSRTSVHDHSDSIFMRNLSLHLKT